VNTENLVGKPRREEYLGGLGVGVRIISKYILKNEGMRIWTRCKFLRIRSSGGLL
jgi:hypothetical protein